MRRKLSTLLILIILLTVPSNIVSGIDEDPVIHIDREIKSQKAGIVWYYDTIVISAPNTSQVSLDTFWVGLAEGYTPNRVQIEFLQNEISTPLSYTEESKNGFSGYLINFPSTQTVSGTQSLTLKIEYLFLETVYQTTDANLLYIQTFPLLEYNITNIESIVTLPDGSEFQKIEATPFNVTILDEGDQPWPITYNVSDVSSYDNTSVPITYAPDIRDDFVVKQEYLEREITPTNNGLTVLETHLIKNYGRPFNVYDIYIPINASNVRARDHVGSLPILTYPVENVTDFMRASLAPRSPINNLNMWRFTVEYDLPAEVFISGQTLTYEVGLYDHYVYDLNAVFVLPDGGSFIQSSPEPDNIESGSSTRYVYTFGARLPSEAPSLTIEYAYSPTPSWLMPLAAILLLIGIAGAVVFLRRRKTVKPSIVKVSTNVKAPELSEYLGKYVDRITLLKQYEELLEDGEVKEGKVAEVTRNLGSSKKEIAEITKTLDNTDLASTLRTVSNAEKEVDRVQKDLRNLDVRLRTRRITRKDYAKRRESRINRLKEAISRIEETLASINK